MIEEIHCKKKPMCFGSMSYVTYRTYLLSLIVICYRRRVVLTDGDGDAGTVGEGWDGCSGWIVS